jgi:predicted XRE-type DNA-binding protein
LFEHLYQATAALGIDQPKVSELVRGRFSDFLDQSATLHLNALDRSLEIIAQPSPGENDSLKVTVAL